MTTATTPAAPAPTNGAAKSAPQTPAVTTPPPATVEHPELKAAQERASKAEAEAQRYKREEIINRRKTEGERKTFAEKLKAADEYEQLKREARVNKTAVAKKLWGEKWHEELNTEMANGGAPSPEAILYDNEQREQRLRKEFDERDQKRTQEAQAAQQRAVDARLRAFTTQAIDFAKSAAAEYPLLEQFGSVERIGGALMNRIRAEHDSTIQRDPETNEVVKPGRLMSFKEAAESLEESLFAVAERAASNPKHAEKLRAKLTPAKTPGTVPPVVRSSQPSSQGSESSQSSPQPRRTVGNDMTGSTPPAPSKYRTEQQRQADALAAYERAKKPA